MNPRSADNPDDDLASDLPPSKTQRKHAMHALQNLGEALVALDPKRLAELGLPERLHDALIQARGIRAHEGRRRQIQYIGKLMRDVDAAPIEAALALWSTGPALDQARFARLEQWRERLVADDTALDLYLADFPGADRVKLVALINAARLERSRGNPPHKFRALFRALAAADVPVA